MTTIGTTTPEQIRSPEKQPLAITEAQKQALIDNLQLEGPSLGHVSTIIAARPASDPKRSHRASPQTTRPVCPASTGSARASRDAHQPHSSEPPQGEDADSRRKTHATGQARAILSPTVKTAHRFPTRIAS